MNNPHWRDDVPDVAGASIAGVGVLYDGLVQLPDESTTHARGMQYTGAGDFLPRLRMLEVLVWQVPGPAIFDNRILHFVGM